MALIKCSECGHEISDKSSQCIHCGNPINMDELSHEESVPESTEESVTTDNNHVETVKEEETMDQEFKEEYKRVEKKNRKGLYIFLAIVAFIAIIIIYNESTKVRIPSLYGMKEDTAVTVLTSNNLIPNIVYENNDYVDEGSVIETNPSAYSKTKKNSTVFLYISKGPAKLYASHYVITWRYVGNAEDKWEFDGETYIEDGELHIPCKATFGTTFNFKGGGFGEASILDTFSKKVPMQVNISNDWVEIGKEQKIEFVIPTKDLDVQKPTTLYTHTSIIANDGTYQNLSIDFSITW